MEVNNDEEDAKHGSLVPEKESCANRGFTNRSNGNVKITSQNTAMKNENLVSMQEKSRSLPTDNTSGLESSQFNRGLAIDFKSLSVRGETLHAKEKVFRYGWWCFTPLCLQPILNNAKAFIIIVTLANVLQGVVVNGLLKVNVTSIERRYKLLSYESGFIISSYDVAGCLCLLPISYIGGRGHKPRWVSFGVLMMGVGSFVLAMPRFLAGPYSYTARFSAGGSDVEPGLCQRGADTLLNVTDAGFDNDLCDGSQRIPDSYLKQMKYVFMLGQFFNGIGNTPLSVLAVTFLDENVDKQVYPIYIGIYYLGALVGPAFGFVLGGRLLTIFTNVRETPEDITPVSPEWIGAWWVGFIIAGVLTVLLSIPLFGYPRKLGRYPKKRKVAGCCYTPCWRDSRLHSEDVANSEMTGKYCSTSASEETEVQPIVSLPRDNRISMIMLAGTSSSVVLMRDFCGDIMAVLSNRTFIFLSMSAALYSTLVSGFSTFGPKFIESQLGKSAADAANLFGYVCVPAGAGGMLIGAFLMTGLKMSHKSALQMCLAVSVGGLIAHFVLVLDCEDLYLAGINVPYNFYNANVPAEPPYANLTMTSACNANCACPASTHFNPVCGGNNITYFSPCHAGCSVIGTEEMKTFRRCSCVEGKDLVEPGVCPKTCQWQTLILFGLFVVILATFVCTVPGIDISLRCFPHHQRSLAVGVQWVFIRTLGSIPGPIIFGAVIDGTCLLWGKTACNGEKGSCLLYKNAELSSSFLVLSVAYKVAGIITLFLALVFIKRDVVGSLTDAHDPREVAELPVPSDQPSTSGAHPASS